MRFALALVALVSASSLSACVPLFCVACEGYLGVVGEVYEWLDAPAGANSVAIIDVPVSQQHRVSPAVGAEVTLEPWTPRSRSRNSDTSFGHRQTLTDKDGHFRVGGTVRPGSYRATLSVQAPGFRPIEQVFDHNHQGDHKVRVLLVREK